MLFQKWSAQVAADSGRKSAALAHSDSGGWISDVPITRAHAPVEGEEEVGEGEERQRGEDSNCSPCVT